jgi:hypothetical protein
MGRKNHPSSGKQVRKGYDYGPDIVDHPIAEQMEQDNKEAKRRQDSFITLLLVMIFVLLLCFPWIMHSCNKPEIKPEPAVPVTAPIQRPDTSITVIPPNVAIAVIQENAGKIVHKEGGMCKECGVHFFVNGIPTDYEAWAKGK